MSTLFNQFVTKLEKTPPVSSANVTRRALALGDADTITGWYAKSFSETTIKMVILSKGAVLVGLPTGNYAKHTLTGFTSTAVIEGDEIKDSNNTYYQVETVEEVWERNNFSHYICGLTKLPIHYDMPTTYGVGASVDDPRKRTSVWITSYINGANLLKNDGLTEAAYSIFWANPPYHIKPVFVTKAVDIAFPIGRVTSKPILDSDHYAIGYEEKVSIFPTTIDKTGILGENLMWQGERELRRIAETYPLGTLRNFETMTSRKEVLGSTTLYSVECVLEYERDLD